MEEVNFDLLGSTGSIGEQAIDVARRSGFRIVSLCACRNVRRVEEQVREFKPRFCAMADADAAKELRVKLADTDTKVYGGAEGILRMIEESPANVSLNAILGEAGLLPTLTVIRSGKKLALANKESLVVAGEIVMREAVKNHTLITPVDSEHCAIHQCLRAGEHGDVKKLLVTASGGPFFGMKKDELANVTAAQALAHPTWSMGAKITIDSATLMNKGFELIEASRLFGIDLDRIEAIIQRESIIHSMVEYIDNSVIAQMSLPDMRSCIQYGLCGGVRMPAVIGELDLAKIATLHFYTPDSEAFPLLPLAVRCGKTGGGMTAVLNAANEVAVDAFLKEKICFAGLCDLVAETVDAMESCRSATELDEILDADKAARRYVAERYLGKGD